MKMTLNQSKPHYTTRQATLADVEPVRRMQADSWRATYVNEAAGVSQAWVDDRTAGWLTPEALKTSREVIGKVLADDSQFYRVAERDGEIVGFVYASHQDDGTIELNAIYTAPDTFGTGLGQQLIDQAIAYADGAQMELKVASYNTRAIRFYEKNGFKIVPDSEVMFADKIPIVKMLREGGVSNAFKFR